jgi:hypothetical protein
MSHRPLPSLMLAAAAMGAIAATAAQAQQMPLVYVVHDAPRPGCPGLVLHFTASDRSIAGFASYDDMKGVSRIVGTRNGLGHFDMTLHPIDPTGPKGRIVGDASDNNDAIRSVLKGEGCNDGPLRIQTISITNG